MERQLKERLIGAAVLIAIAVIMVPEMFSGLHGRAQPPGDATAPASQLTTYHIELQPTAPALIAAAASVDSQSSVEQPAERPVEQPRDERSPSADSTSTPPAPVSNANSQSFSSSRDSNKAAAGESEVRTPPASITKGDAAKPAVVTTTAVESGWTIQIGSFGTREKAQQIAGKLKAQGYSAVIGPVTVANKTLYRVRVGSATERSTAEAKLKPLKPMFPGASVVQAGH